MTFNDGPNALQRFAPRGHRRGRRTAPISGPLDLAPRSYPFGRPSSLHARPTPRAHGPTVDPAPGSTLQPRAAQEGRRRSGEHSTRPRRRTAAILGSSEHAASPLPPGKVFRRHSRASYEAQVPATTHRRQHARPSRHIAMSVPIPHNRSFPLHASLLTTPCSNLQPKPTQHQNQTNPNQTAFPLPPVRQRGKSPLVTHPLLPPVRQWGKSPLVKRAPFPLARHHHAGTLRLFHPFPSSLYQTWRTTLHQTRRITSTLTCLPSYSHMTHALPHISVSHPRLPG